MKITRLSWRDLAPELARSLDSFSLYTSPAFLEVIESVGGRSGYFAVEEDGRVTAALPMVEYGRGLFCRLQALTDGQYAPIWIHESEKSRTAELSDAILNHIGSRSYLKAIVTDFDNRLSARDWELIETETSLVDLASTDKTTPWLPPDKTLCAEIAKAERDGVRVVEFNCETHLASFLSLVLQTEKRHERQPKYSEVFWRALANLSTRDSRILWLCVESERTMVASHIYLVDRRAALNWQIYFDKRFSVLKPNQAIMYTAANRLKQAGVNYLNLGATPPDASGVEAYKEKWGGRPYRYRIWRKNSFLGRWL